MKRLLLMIAVAFPVWAQPAPNARIDWGLGAPSGRCPNVTTEYVDTLAQNLYICPATGGTWVLTGGGGSGTISFESAPTPTAIITDFDPTHIQTPNVETTIDGSGNLAAGGSITSGAGCTGSGCISYVHTYDTDAAHDTVQIGATTSYNGTNTWDGNVPSNGYVWTAYGVSGNNATVGWLSGGSVIPTGTVAAMLATTSAANSLFLPNDALSGSDCGVGGGAPGTFSLCAWTGSSWVSVPFGGTGGGTLQIFLGFDGSGQLTTGTAYSTIQNNGAVLPGETTLNFTAGGCSDNGINSRTNCTFAAPSGLLTSGDLAVWSGTAGMLVDGGPVPVSPTSNQNLRTIGAVLTPSALTGCIYVNFSGTINGFRSNTVDGATSSTVLIKVETQATRSTFLSTGVSGASDISNGGEQLTSVLGKDDTTLTSWTTSLAAGTTVCFVGSGFTLGTSVNAEITVAAN